MLAHAFAYSSAIPEVFPEVNEHYAWVYFPEPDLKIVWARDTGYKPFVVWNMQLDVVDLYTRITTYNTDSRPAKRRRTAVNQFWEVSFVPGEDLGTNHHLPETTKFNGVRYRKDRNRWVAETRPYKGANKTQFGEFKSQTEAALAIDAAYYYYGKRHSLNFSETTPMLLSSRSPSKATVLQDEKAKLRFVKGEAKWLASVSAIATPTQLETAEYSWSGGFRSYSEISSFLSFEGGDENEPDDGNS